MSIKILVSENIKSYRVVASGIRWHSLIGAPGPQGPQGIPGPIGPQGQTGDQGAKGETGLKGDQGVQGVAGPQGSVGPQGLKGDTGLQGAQGLKGDTGSTGSTGSQGVQGVAGPKGDTGTQGIQGIQGPQGIQGSQGIKGDKGDSGKGFVISKVYSSVSAILADTSPTGISAGEFGVVTTADTNSADNGRLYLWDGFTYTFMVDISGTQGVKGDTGAQGVQGPQGAQGIQGLKGDAGIKGDTGPAGPQGVQGIQGIKGDVGDIGAQGIQGVAGPQGQKGDPYLINSTTLTTNTDLGASVYNVFVSNGSNLVHTLPTPSIVANKEFTIRNSHSTIMTLTGTISSDVDPYLFSKESITFWSDGTNLYYK